MQACCDVVAAWFSQVQDAHQFAAHARAGGSGKRAAAHRPGDRMQLPQTGLCVEWAEHVLGQQHAAAGLVKAHRYAKAARSGPGVDRRRIHRFHGQRFDFLACEPLAQHEQGQHAVFHALARHGQVVPMWPG